MSDLMAFLKARLDEDEAAAKAWLPFGNPDAAAREHIARHDPGRVLREVAAKRAILAAHPQERVGGRTRYRNDVGCALCHQDDGVQYSPGYCATVRAVASVYSDHPDYDQDWKP